MAPKAPPLARGPTGSPAGRHHAASVSSGAGSTHTVRSTASQSPSGRSMGGTTSAVVLRPWTLPAARLASASVSATTQEPGSSSGPSPGTATKASSGAVSAAKPPRPSGTSGPTVWRLRPSRVARRSEAFPSGGAHSDWLDTGIGAIPTATSQASSTVCQPVQRQRWACRARAARSRSGSTSLSEKWLSANWLTVDPSSPTKRRMMPGVQNPHWLPPVAQKASDQRWTSPSDNPSSVVTDRPDTRRSGVTHDTRGWPSTSTVQHPHCPWGLQPSLTDRRFRGPRSASSRVPPTSTNSTGWPSTVRCTDAPSDTCSVDAISIR